MSLKGKVLTKSLFILALECPSKLYYINKKKYANNNLNYDFLKSLAEGGFQVGALAKLYFPNGIQIDELEHEIALKKTEDLLKSTDIIIYEAAFLYKNLFIRSDILIKKGEIIELIEVKAKSFDSTSDTFLNKGGYIIPGWKPYLYDVAFQAYVLKKLFPSYEIRAFLMLADKSKVTTVDGLNQKFSIEEIDGRKSIKIIGNTDSGSLGQEILVKVPVNDILDRIYNETDSKEEGERSFEDFINETAESYIADKKILPVLGGHCRDCEFKASHDQLNQGLQSGFRECWKEQANFKPEDFDKPSILDVWDFRKKDNYIEEGKYFQNQLTRDDFEAKKPKPSIIGLSRVDRQELQINKSKKNDKSVFFDKEGFSEEMGKWKFPLHFIDFETTAVAIPFNINKRPYEQIAFQFSHHVVHDKDTIEHKGQWINSKRGYFPNFDFIRELKKQLSDDKGTIFRYATHENTILNKIAIQLSNSTEPDRNELIDWIKTITNSTGSSSVQWEGERNMVDLREMVLRYFYNAQMGGSNSLKDVLPAILNSSEYLKNKYSSPIYGSKIKSHNYNNHSWININSETGLVENPYKNLPPVFDGIPFEMAEGFVLDEDSDIKEGGAAMIAYSKMQFSHISEDEKQKIIEALLRYCELDTMAMVFLWEAWNNWCQN